MKYELVKANENDIELLINYKLNTILEYANDIEEVEKKKINNYVKNEIPKQLVNYKLIKIKDNIVGCVLVRDYQDGVLLDEIYLENNFRNHKIGSQIINEILTKNNIVYLWVYKDNKKAIKLYNRLEFKILEETESRYFMKFKR